MKHVITGLFFLTLSISARADKGALQISHHIEEIPVSRDFSMQLNDFAIMPERDGDLALELDQIINIGKRIWKLIEENQPVLNVKYQYANALPKGLKSSEDLEGFSDLKSRAFRAWGTNLYGVTVYDVEYVAIHRFGGTYRGTGRYIENATVLPRHIEVAWGYTLNYDVTNVSTVNVGTKDNPIASLLLETRLSVSTILKKSEEREVFEFRGDSPLVKVSN